MSQCVGCHEREGVIEICCPSSGEPIVNVCYECLIKHFEILEQEPTAQPPWLPAPLPEGCQ